MKAVILAGGQGSRLSEETELLPKPMVEIGGRPILWHIMKIYSHYGVNDFVVCLGHQGYVIKEYFANYFLHMSDVTFDLGTNSMEVHGSQSEPWRVTLVDTGANSMTGGRIKRIREHVDGQRFLLTYGDGVANIDVASLLRFHESHGRIATLTSIQPAGRFGRVGIGANSRIDKFEEKLDEAGAWVNGGFFVLEPAVFDRIEGDATIFEHEPLESLASSGELFAYKHDGFWLGMDTPRDRRQLETLWASGGAPWKVWP
jgi:glucose-1-phosphate cytidylyltransferase